MVPQGGQLARSVFSKSLTGWDIPRDAATIPLRSRGTGSRRMLENDTLGIVVPDAPFR